jgi:hypothetical protein
VTRAGGQPERWAIVALMGHRQVAGRISEELVAGTPMLRLDIPLADDTWSTRLFGGAAIYEITYVDEPVARAVAARDPAHPISIWSAQNLGLLPKSDPPPAARHDVVLDEEDEQF